MSSDPSELPVSRILFDRLEYDDELALLNGEPFSGIVYSEYDNGMLELEFNYVEGLPSGLQKQWFRNGQIERVSMARRGNGSSRIEYWHENGVKKIERTSDENNILTYYREWDEEGNLIHQRD